MIAYLEGKARVAKDKLVVMVNGVGYGVTVAATTLATTRDGQDIGLWVHTHVREDVLELFGFSTEQDKELFDLLLTVSGVGPRTALAISEVGSQAIITAVQTADVSAFSGVPRVGKKVAQKIIIELKSKLGSLQELHLGAKSQPEQDVIDALSALGFREADIQKALRNLEITEESDSSVLIKKAIKVIGS